MCVHRRRRAFVSSCHAVHVAITPGRAGPGRARRQHSGDVCVKMRRCCARLSRRIIEARTGAGACAELCRGSR